MAGGFLDGWLIAEQQRLQQEQARRQAEAHALQQMGGLLGMQNNILQQQEHREDRPLKRQLMEAQIRQAANKGDAKWQAVEQFNPKTGQKEKVLVNMNNPSQIIPMGGQESKPLSFQNLGNAVVGLDPMTGQPRTMPQPLGVSPNTSAQLQQNRDFRGSLSATDQANIGLRADEHFYNTGRTPLNMGPAQGAALPSPRPNQPVPPGMMGPQEINQFSPQASAVQNPALAATESRVRTAEMQPNGGGMIPTASVVPPRSPIIDTVPPKQQAQLRADQPQAQTSASTVLQNLDRMDKMAEELSTHRGLPDITGKLDQYEIFDMYDATRGARGLSNALTRQVSIQVLQSMRDASKTGGAVGQVTEKEWPRLEQGIAALDNAQSAPDYRTALTNLQNQLKTSRERVLQAYQSTYGPLQYKAPEYQKQGNSTIPQDAAAILNRANAIIGRQ